MKNVLNILFVLLITNQPIFAETYHFVSIKNLIEQEVGRIIIPEIYKKLDLDVSIKPLPAKRAQLMARAGKKDGEIMRIWTYGIENPTTIRVPTPYYSLETMAFIKKNSGVVINTKDDLKKYKLAKVRGVKHTNNVTIGMPFVRDVDGILIIKKLGYKDIDAINQPLANLALYHYIHESKKNIIPKVDAVIKKMIVSGEMEKLIKEAENQTIEIYQK